MKKLLSLVTFCAMACGTPVLAQESSSGASSNNNVNVGVSTYGSDIPSRTTVRTTGIATANGAISVIECGKVLGFGGGIIGGAGSINIPVGGRRCDIRQGVQVLGNMAAASGDRRYLRAADNLLCDDDLYGRALLQAGVSCPQETRAGRMVRQVASSTNESAKPVLKRASKASLAKGTRYYDPINMTWKTK